MHSGIRVGCPSNQRCIELGVRAVGDSTAEHVVSGDLRGARNPVQSYRLSDRGGGEEQEVEEDESADAEGQLRAESFHGGRLTGPRSRTAGDL